jgi:hypothetical protein
MANTRAFIINEKERSVTTNRAAQSGAELILLKYAFGSFEIIGGI